MGSDAGAAVGAAGETLNVLLVEAVPVPLTAVQSQAVGVLLRVDVGSLGAIGASSVELRWGAKWGEQSPVTFRSRWQFPEAAGGALLVEMVLGRRLKAFPEVAGGTLAGWMVLGRLLKALPEAAGGTLVGLMVVRRLLKALPEVAGGTLLGLMVVGRLLSSPPQAAGGTLRVVMVVGKPVQVPSDAQQQGVLGSYRGMKLGGLLMEAMTDPASPQVLSVELEGRVGWRQAALGRQALAGTAAG